MKRKIKQLSSNSEQVWQGREKSGNGSWLGQEIRLNSNIANLPRMTNISKSVQENAQRKLRVSKQRIVPIPSVKPEVPLQRTPSNNVISDLRRFAKNQGFNLTAQSVELLDKVLTHLTTYSAKFDYYTYPILSTLFREDMRKRISGPQIEDLAIEDKRDETGQGEIFGGNSKTLQVHRNLRMPFKLIPNCSMFKLEEKGYDGLAVLFGYPLKCKHGDVQIRNGKNGKANKYLVSMFLQLRTLRDQSRIETDECRKQRLANEYFKLGGKLMANRAYLISALNFIFPNGYQDFSHKKVYSLIKEVDKLITEKSVKLKSHRKYIPKRIDKEGLPILNEEGKGSGVRPLGVPSPAGRVYLHMLNNLIVWFRLDTEGSQHAYLPQKGIATAGAEIFKKMKSYPYIYEFDLKGFFDNVDLGILYEHMQKSGFPEDFSNFMKRLNRSITVLEKEDKIEEVERKLHLNTDLSLNPNLDAKEIEEGYNQMDVAGSWYGTTDPEEEAFSVYKGKDISGPVQKEKGVPQGAPTSCGLSTIILDALTRNEMGSGIHVIMYADDGLIFSKTQKGIEKIKSYLESIKIEMKEGGSGYVKFKGKGEKELKFLGLTYNGNIIKASTRNGSTLEFDSVSMFLSFLLMRREQIVYGGSATHLNSRYEKFEGVSPKEGINNELGNFLYYENPARMLFEKTSGYFLSALFNNSGNLAQPTERKLLFKPKSGISCRGYSYQQEILRKHFVHLIMSEYGMLKKALGLKMERLYTRDELKEFAKGVGTLKNQKRLEALCTLMLKIYGPEYQTIEEMRQSGISFEEFREKLNYSDLQSLGAVMPLTRTNASSYACNDLLRNETYQKNKIQFVLEEEKSKLSYPRTASKLKKATRKLIKDFRNFGGVNLLLRPLLLSMKPNVNVNYGDKRKYYPKRGLFTQASAETRYPKLVLMKWNGTYWKMYELRRITLLVMLLLSSALMLENLDSFVSMLKVEIPEFSNSEKEIEVKENIYMPPPIEERPMEFGLLDLGLAAVIGGYIVVGAFQIGWSLNF